MFKDRKDAGEKLSHELEEFKNKNAVVLAIPRGGVEIGRIVAKALNADFSLIVCRKLPFPDNPESGFGAIAEDNSMFIFNSAKKWLTENQINQIIDEQKDEIKKRISSLRKNTPLPKIIGRDVILIDDGIAMGSTMRAAIKLCKNKNTRKITVAAPVSSERVTDELAELVDEIIVMEKPENFRAVAQVYENWYDLTDKDVQDILKGY